MKIVVKESHVENDSDLWSLYYRSYHKLVAHLDCNMEVESPCGRVYVRSSGAGITLHVRSSELRNDTITVECIKHQEVLIQIEKPTLNRGDEYVS